MRDFILPVGHCIYSSVIRNLSVVSYSLYWWAYQPKLSATISLKIHISYPQFLNSDQVTGGNVKVGPKTRDKEDKWGFLSHDQSLNDGELSCEKGLKVSTWRSWNYRQRKVEKKRTRDGQSDSKKSRFGSCNPTLIHCSCFWGNFQKHFHLKELRIPEGKYSSLTNLMETKK